MNIRRIPTLQSMFRVRNYARHEQYKGCSIIQNLSIIFSLYYMENSKQEKYVNIEPHSCNKFEAERFRERLHGTSAIQLVIKECSWRLLLRNKPFVPNSHWSKVLYDWPNLWQYMNTCELALDDTYLSIVSLNYRVTFAACLVQWIRNTIKHLIMFNTMYQTWLS